jgi:hypothetical protein
MNFIRGEYYYLKHMNYVYIVKARETRDKLEGHYIRLKTTTLRGSYYRGGNFGKMTNKKNRQELRKATVKEKQFLEKCIEENKYLDFDIFTASLVKDNYEIC